MCPSGTSLQNGGVKDLHKSNLRTAFDVMDADGDGKIGSEDLRAFYGGLSCAGPSDEEAIGSMISLADTNKDGYVEFEEFQKVLNGRRRRSESVRVTAHANTLMEDAFKVMDKDGDGKVDCEDLRSYLKWAGFEACDEEIRAMIRLGCGDEKGGVTLECLLKVLAM